MLTKNYLIILAIVLGIITHYYITKDYQYTIQKLINGKRLIKIWLVCYLIAMFSLAFVKDFENQRMNIYCLINATVISLMVAFLLGYGRDIRNSVKYVNLLQLGISVFALFYQ